MQIPQIGRNIKFKTAGNYSRSRKKIKRSDRDESEVEQHDAQSGRRKTTLRRASILL
jgi:hypothetical protein